MTDSPPRPVTIPPSGGMQGSTPRGSIQYPITDPFSIGSALLLGDVGLLDRVSPERLRRAYQSLCHVQPLECRALVADVGARSARRVGRDAAPDGAELVPTSGRVSPAVARYVSRRLRAAASQRALDREHAAALHAESCGPRLRATGPARVTGHGPEAWGMQQARAELQHGVRYYDSYAPTRGTMAPSLLTAVEWTAGRNRAAQTLPESAGAVLAVEQAQGHIAGGRSVRPSGRRGRKRGGRRGRKN